ncbi:MAG: PspC domain-containing protein [Candidatus Promineofilum sp.]|uniref:PspC domain-containing protein n=1 Tax=Promineifilum sp. TaxID=2664178 RepID=UPI002411F480|nr:PspC domain-containing protein [Promineifilum sp.]
MQQTRLMRSETDKMIAGVCGGLADYVGIDPVLVRLAFVFLLLASGVGFAIYVVLWIVMPTPSRSQPQIHIVSEDEFEDPAAYKTRFSPAATVGVLLILFGGFFLLSQMGNVPGFIWPIILIGAGVFYLVRRARD